MIKKFLKNKKGVTLLESLIALLLLAVVATGTFAVLLSTSRKSLGPDIREEMALAIEKASDMLQGAVVSLDSDVPNYGSGFNYQKGPCGLASSHALSSGSHNNELNCLLPPICDPSHSHFSYEISSGTDSSSNLWSYNSTYDRSDRLERTTSNSTTADQFSTGLTTGATKKNGVKIIFDIECNGFTL